MNVSKHTPAPWLLNIRDGTTRIYSIYGGAEAGKTICRIHAYKGQTTEANANLIALATAAPHACGEPIPPRLRSPYGADDPRTFPW